MVDWPAGSSPEEIGKRVAENFVARPIGDSKIHYAEACTWYGSLAVAALTRDRDLGDRLVLRFEPLLSPPGSDLLPSRNHVDDRVFGIVPLQIAIDKNTDPYLAMGRDLADGQWQNTTPDGITSEARYWIDDMYMITALQVQAFRATGEGKYLDRAARTMSAYLDQLQQPNGLFFHTAKSPVHWGRGNGWVSAGMTELLLSLPPDHPEHPRILEGYRAMMASLLEYQTDEGVWRQIIDDDDAWPETSGSAMFAFGLAAGTKNGWLDADAYRDAARAAWLGILEYLDADANLREVCIGAGDANSQGYPSSDPAAQRQYYLDRPRSVGDFHGQAPIAWTAAALLR